MNKILLVDLLRKLGSSDNVFNFRWKSILQSNSSNVVYAEMYVLSNEVYFTNQSGKNNYGDRLEIRGIPNYEQVEVMRVRKSVFGSFVELETLL